MSKNAIEQLAETSLDDDTHMKVREEVDFLSNVGIDLSNLHKIEPKEDSIVYTYVMDNGIESVIDIKKENNGDMVFNISENGKKDEIIITSDGKVFSDGIEISVESFEDDSLNIQGLQPMSVSYNTMDCPRGVPSDYNEYYMTVSNFNIELSKKLSEYTIIAFSILLSGLSGSPFLAGICYAIAEEVICGFGSVDPDPLGLSYKATVYSHKDGPYYGTIYRKYYTT